MNKELFNNKNYKLVTAIVKKGLGSRVIEIGKEAGSKDGIIVFGIGTASKNVYLDLLGINFEPEKEIVIIAAEENIAGKVLNTIANKLNMEKEGRGIAFMIPIKKIKGLNY